MNPFTDQQLAESLKISRATITRLRSKLGIENARERRAKALAKLINQEKDEGKSSFRSVARSLEKKDIRVSHTTVGKLECDASIINQGENTNVSSSSDIIHTVFKGLVGAENSLRCAIELAQAAVNYPPRGLHTLIVGPTGVGKTELAMAMYHYAVAIGRLSQEAPFVSFNCADYTDNPQLLMSHLFGHKKGAYTGALEDTVGLVETANNGVLFLDEIHRLPPQGQEMLFSILDRGCYRRLGETSRERKTSFLLIAATSFPSDMALIEAMRRRIPVLISLPPLSLRPKEERRELVIRFLAEEAGKINSEIELDPLLLEALLTYHCPGNVGQLKADIQVACAQAYLKYTVKVRDRVAVCIDDAPQPVIAALSEISLKSKEWPGMEARIIIRPQEEKLNHQNYSSHTYTFSTNVYEWLERCYQKQSNIKDPVQRALAVAKELEKFIETQFNFFESNHAWATKDNPTYFVQPAILKALTAALAKEYPYILKDRSLIICISMHLTSSAEHYRAGEYAINTEELLRLGKLNEELREVAARILKHITLKTGIRFPPYEEYLLALYLRYAHLYDKERVLPGIGILLLSYGHVARAVRDVVETLLPGFELQIMDLEYGDDWQQLWQRLEKALKETDKGAGVLVITDEGLDSVIRAAAVRCGLNNVRTATPLSSTTVLKAVRGLIEGMELSELARAMGGSISLEEGREDLLWFESHSFDTTIISDYDKSPVILVTCITGKGLATRVAEELRSSFNGNVEFIPSSVMEAEKVWKRERARILASVGPFDPQIKSLPHYPASEVLTPQGIRLLKILVQQHHSRRLIKGTGIREIFDTDLVFLNIQFEEQGDIIRYLCKNIERHGCVTKGFVNTVLEREHIGSTYVGNWSAIPHGMPEEVIRPAIAIGSTTRDCLWGDGPVRLVFLLALRQEAKKVIKQLYENVLSNKQLIAKLLETNDKNTFVKLLMTSIGF